MLVHFTVWTADCDVSDSACLGAPTVHRKKLRQAINNNFIFLVHSAKELRWVNIWSEGLRRWMDKSMPLTGQDEVAFVSLILIFWILEGVVYFIVLIPCLQHASFPLLCHITSLVLDLDIPVAVWMPVGRQFED